MTHSSLEAEIESTSKKEHQTIKQIISEKQNLENLSKKLKSFEGKNVDAHSIYLNRSDDSNKGVKVSSIASGISIGSVTVSYTHLTLPTKA